MKEIQKKNYFILVVLLVVTAVITLLLAYVYSNKENFVSDFYQYSYKITQEEFKQFMTENSDVIIYISDKYDLSHSEFEKSFQKKIEDLNLKHNLIFIDKSEISDKFLKELKKSYNINVKLDSIPIVVVIVDKKVIKNVSILPDTNVETLIEYGDLK